jgi:hypothetical protein
LAGKTKLDDRGKVWEGWEIVLGISNSSRDYVFSGKVENRNVVLQGGILDLVP